jgi:hypothetical protein
MGAFDARNGGCDECVLLDSVCAIVGNRDAGDAVNHDEI